MELERKLAAEVDRRGESQQSRQPRNERAEEVNPEDEVREESFSGPVRPEDN